MGRHTTKLPWKPCCHQDAPRTNQHVLNIPLDGTVGLGSTLLKCLVGYAKMTSRADKVIRIAKAMSGGVIVANNF
jgi:hypothetical protein